MKEMCHDSTFRIILHTTGHDLRNYKHRSAIIITTKVCSFP